MDRLMSEGASRPGATPEACLNTSAPATLRQAAVTAKDVELLRLQSQHEGTVVDLAAALDRRCIEDAKQAGLNRQEALRHQWLQRIFLQRHARSHARRSSSRSWGSQALAVNWLRQILILGECEWDSRSAACLQTRTAHARIAHICACVCVYDITICNGLHVAFCV